MRTHAPADQIASAPPQRRRPELLWVGEGGWVACDPEADADDPGRVLAYLECKDSVVYVLFVRGRTEVVEFESLRAAIDAVDAILVGGVRAKKRPISMR
ncbi:hypothetical protein [Microbacterium yannicii]|uniref:hypothetical protein n=1 Tax=Microbacterium yannicii TaxID=671622 RepID=UPI00031ED397|nr:hypothetical protein [Microbacterium yannicii]